MNGSDGVHPIPAGERINALDVLRGFALLGIFLMNIEFFSRPLQDIGGAGIDPLMQGADYVADALIYFFVQSKFWTLFSLLFGMGFAVMIERARHHGRPFLPTYLRRTLALLGIGLVHAVLIWSGDILVSYAIGAFTLLLLRGIRHGWRRWRDKAEPAPMPAGRLARWGVGLYAFPLVLLLVGGGIASLVPADAVPPAQASQRAEAFAKLAAQRDGAIEAYSQGSYADAVAQRASDTAMQFGNLPFFLFLLLGVFMVGAAVIRSGMLGRPGEFLPQIRRFRNVALPAGFAVMGLSVALGTAPPLDSFGFSFAVQMSSYLAAGLLLSLAYAATLVVALQGAAGPWLQAWLAPAGRMALTNYLTQSLLCTLLFYHYGLGLWGQVGRAAQVGLVLAVYATQLVLSRWWLARFQFGPMEWLWRAITYWTWPGMRKAPA